MVIQRALFPAGFTDVSRPAGYIGRGKNRGETAIVGLPIEPSIFNPFASEV